jgi:SPP1 family predicted phage head-tail adaptor
MEAGKLRHRLIFQEKAATVNSLGEPLTWTTSFTVWGSVEPLSGREFFEAKQVQAQVSHRVRIRYRSGVAPSMRILYGTRAFDIQEVIDTEERHAELVLMCQERVTD